MSGKRAKRLRREVYGEQSIRQRQYGRNQRGDFVNVGLRARYRQAKRDYMANK